jgi:hypothetical protein
VQSLPEQCFTHVSPRFGALKLPRPEAGKAVGNGSVAWSGSRYLVSSPPANNRCVPVRDVLYLASFDCSLFFPEPLTIKRQSHVDMMLRVPDLLEIVTTWHAVTKRRSS